MVGQGHPEGPVDVAGGQQVLLQGREVVGHVHEQHAAGAGEPAAAAQQLGRVEHVFEHVVEPEHVELPAFGNQFLQAVVEVAGAQAAAQAGGETAPG